MEEGTRIVGSKRGSKEGNKMKKKTIVNTTTSNEWDRHWFHSFCIEQEIDRIVDPKTPKDFLLRQRADIVADNVRYLRVYRNRAQIMTPWSFESSFVDSHYLAVLNSLSREDRALCSNITYGDMFSNDVNGYAMYDPTWGRFIYLNESLIFFMKFCNLALLDFNSEVPMNVRFNAVRIALRIMMKSETMDFLMDPRGIVPEDVHDMIHAPIESELQYIAGHEFFHHICNHLNNSNLVQKAFLTIDGNEYTGPIYSVSQKQEFEADIASINRPLYSAEDKIKLVESALLWFTSLEMAEVAQSIISPASSFSVKSHPSAIERYNNVLNNIDVSYDTEKFKRIRERVERYKELITEDLSFNYDMYESYGSAYLDKPNTKWRGKELIDRVDY
jgi:hypothetical protein